jgi:hypothetical protein
LANIEGSIPLQAMEELIPALTFISFLLFPISPSGFLIWEIAHLKQLRAFGSTTLKGLVPF